MALTPGVGNAIGIASLVVVLLELTSLNEAPGLWRASGRRVGGRCTHHSAGGLSSELTELNKKHIPASIRSTEAESQNDVVKITLQLFRYSAGHSIRTGRSCVQSTQPSLPPHRPTHGECSTIQIKFRHRFPYPTPRTSLLHR